MKLLNSTDRTITVHSAAGPLTVEAGKALLIRGSVTALEMNASGEEASLGLPPQALVGGVGDDTPPDNLDGGVGDDTPPDNLDGGVGDDTPPDDLTGGGDDPGGASAPAMLLRNSGDAPLKVLIEKSIPVEKAFRLLGRLGTLEVVEHDGGLAVILRASDEPARS